MAAVIAPEHPASPDAHAAFRVILSLELKSWYATQQKETGMPERNRRKTARRRAAFKKKQKKRRLRAAGRLR